MYQPWPVLVHEFEEHTMSNEYTTMYILDRPLRYSPMTSLGITLSYCLAFTIGCCGNIAVVAAVHNNLSLRSRTNLFIVNLAVADLLINIVCVPFSLWCNLFDEWIFGPHMCKLVAFCQGVSVTASVYTLIAISLERCIVVACPFSAMVSLRKCIVSVWTLAILVNIPWLAVYRIEFMPLDLLANTVVIHNSSGGGRIPSNASLVPICNEAWPNQQAETVFFAFACLSISYLCPLFAIATCNFVIWRTIINRNAIGEDIFAQQRAEINRTKLKVTKMVLVVVITFFLSWLPLYAILCFVKFSGNARVVLSVAAQNFIHITLPIAQFLGASNSSINPILYAFMNKKFREGFKAIFCRNKRIATSSQSPTNDFTLATVSSHIVR